MNIEVIENEDNKLKIKIDDLTLVNLLNETIWRKATKSLDYSAYIIEHPYLSKPVLTVKSKDPKKTVIDAAEQIIEDAGKLKKSLEKEK